MATVQCVNRDSALQKCVLGWCVQQMTTVVRTVPPGMLSPIYYHHLITDNSNTVECWFLQRPYQQLEFCIISQIDHSNFHKKKCERKRHKTDDTLIISAPARFNPFPVHLKRNSCNLSTNLPFSYFSFIYSSNSLYLLSPLLLQVLVNQI